MKRSAGVSLIRHFSLKDYILAVSIFYLAISIVMGSWLVSRGLSSKQKRSNVTTSTPHKLLTLRQVSIYLSFYVSTLNK